MKFRFKYKNKRFDLNVDVCESVLSQARGLMFREKSKPLLFVFKNKKRRRIHSFFCVPFIAIWLDGGKVIEVKIVNPWKFSVRPKQEFDRLLEIPSNDVTYKGFLDEEKV